MKPGLAPRARAAGFSLIELLVSMVIGLVVTLAITSVLIRTEGSKRGTTSVNDLNQTGAYTAFVLDRAIRSAGSGFSQSWSTAYGCLLDASYEGTPVLPLPAAIPATSAFANITPPLPLHPLPIRLAPVIIGKGLADTTGVGAQVRGDVLIVMGGTAGVGESPQSVLPGSATATNLRLPNTLGYRTGDMVLLADTGVAGGCMMQQITFPGSTAGSTDQNLPLAGTYYAATGTHVSLASFGASTITMQLGNAVGNLPQFQLFGVGNNNTLVSYDLLQPTPPDIEVADGVVEMRALYGVETVDTTTNPLLPTPGLDGKLDAWVDPIDLSGYEVSVLTNGSPASQTKLRQIVAIRLGLILRTSLQERSKLVDPVNGYDAPAAITLFGDATDALGISLRHTRTLTNSELHYRYRTIEVTVPLRNVLLAPSS